MVNVMFAGNVAVFDGMLITLLSMTKHTSEQINVYCLTMDLRDINEKYIPINESQIKKLEDILKKKNKDSKITLLDLTKIFKEEMLDSVNLQNKFTPYSMLRLFADEIDALPDKIIYLDTDTIINRDISELYNIDIEDYEVGAVTDIYKFFSPSRWFKKFYFNAGVVLMNMKKIKETGMLKTARNLCKYNKMFYMDQDALNKSVSYVKKLPTKFNSKDKYYDDIVVHHFCNVREGKIHFVGKWWNRIKPWHVELVKQKTNAYNDILDEYLKLKNS